MCALGQELFALGAANAAAGITQGIPVGASGVTHDGERDHGRSSRWRA